MQPVSAGSELWQKCKVKGQLITTIGCINLSLTQTLAVTLTPMQKLKVKGQLIQKVEWNKHMDERKVTITSHANAISKYTQLNQQKQQHTHTYMSISMKCIKLYLCSGLQCFDTVGWVSGRASGP